MNQWLVPVWIALLSAPAAMARAGGEMAYPHPESRPDSPLMLDLPGAGTDPAAIDFGALPELRGERSVVSEGNETWRFRLHNYLAHWDGRYWCVWSHGPVVEDNPTQHLRYSTSPDGVRWSEPRMVMGPSEREGFRYIARGFWLRGDGRLRVLASHDEAFKNGRVHFFGESLELLSYIWNGDAGEWEREGVVFDNAINNFPPQKLPSGEWMMSRRESNRGVSFLVGGVESISDWRMVPFSGYGRTDGLRPEEPCWTALPDDNLAGLFRDNARGGRLLRSFSADMGRSWSPPVQTNFPDATSKFYILRLESGGYVLISNPNPEARNPICLSFSADGLVYTAMARPAVPSEPGDTLQYPHAIEHRGYLLIAYSRNKTAIETIKIPVDGVWGLPGAR